jgi:hypothetical protein
MSDLPLVSCLIATHDFARYLGRSIESVLAQDYPAERIQIVVVDDGSEDETPAVVEPYRDRLTYIRKPNGGLRSTINRGLEEARGDLIAFHSGDDVWLPWRVRVQVEQLQSRPEVGLVYADMRVIDECDRTITESFWRAEGIAPARGRVLGRLLRGNFISGGTLMVRASLRERFQPMPDFAPWEDWWVALRVAEVAEVDYLDLPVFGYRRHGANMNLGAEGTRMVELLAAELPLRRWMLTELESEAVCAADWMGAHNSWAAAVNHVARARGRDADLLVSVSDEQRERARAAARLAGEHLAVQDLDGAARAAVRAAGLDPFAGESSLALAAVRGPLEAEPQLPAGLETTRFVTLAEAEELIEHPHLLAAYRETFSGEDDASLVVPVHEDRVAELQAAVEEAGLGGDEAAAIVAIPFDGEGDGAARLVAELALRVHAVLSRRPPREPVAIRPHVDDRGIDRLRSLAERRWERSQAGSAIA